MKSWKNVTQLGRCNARIYEMPTGGDITIYKQFPTGYVAPQRYEVDSNKVFLLESYSSVVAIAVVTMECCMIYKLPRSSYSVTTSKHVSRFCYWIRDRFMHYATYNASCFCIGNDPVRAW